MATAPECRAKTGGRCGCVTRRLPIALDTTGCGGSADGTDRDLRSDGRGSVRSPYTEDRTLSQHTVLCQTGLPYRNPGPEVRRWERQNGRAFLEIEAGRAMNPEEGRFVDLALPFGPKARLILIHLNAEAIRTGQPVVEVEDSMTAFVKRLLRNDPNGREIRAFKDPLGALSASPIRQMAATARA